MKKQQLKEALCFGIALTHLLQESSGIVSYFGNLLSDESKQFLLDLHRKRMFPAEFNSITKIDNLNDFSFGKRATQKTAGSYYFFVSDNGIALLNPNKSKDSYWNYDEQSWKLTIKADGKEVTTQDISLRVNDGSAAATIKKNKELLKNFINGIDREVKSDLGEYSIYKGNIKLAKPRYPKPKELKKKSNLDSVYTFLIPYIRRYLDQSIADLKGMIVTMVKNSANRNVITRKLNTLHNLEELKFEGSTDVRQFRSILDKALMQTIGYYYPDLNISPDSSIHNFTTRYGTTIPENKKAADEIINKIAAKDIKIFGTFVYFVKRALIL